MYAQLIEKNNNSITSSGDVRMYVDGAHEHTVNWQVYI